jgi:flavin-binding protein dodecin
MGRAILRRKTMLRMIEVVGTSPSGFSEAVQEALRKIAAAGENAHFFQVVEQRGAVRDTQIKEFQVVLKIAVEMKA